MKRILRLANTACLILALSTTAMAAEFQDLGGRLDALQALQSSVDAIAPQTGEALGVQAAQALQFDESSSLQLKSEKTLPLNLGRALRFRQTYKGVPIWNADVVIEENEEGRVIGIEGKAAFNLPTLDVSAAQPALSPEAALEKAKEATGRAASLADSAEYENEEASLVYYLDRNGALKLSYYTTFLIETEDGPSRPVYLIDATTGVTLDFYENIQFAAKGTGPGGNQKTGKYVYGTGTFPKFEVVEQGTNCKMDSPNVKTENLNHASSGSGAPWEFQCDENTVKEINGAYAPLNDAQSFGKVVFDMYKDWYGASPLTNQLHLRVHYRSNYENATWNGRQMSFGDGATRFYPLVSLDVTAHEVSHGFTEQNSGLIYRKESGGMNEAFSDMAGEAAEYYFVNKYGKPFTRPMPDLETGADIFKQAGKALRYMCNPPQDGRSIGHIRDYRDGMNVHYSSGIYNKAFCILSKRSGWNIKKAFDVFVVANQLYWVANETFKGGAAKVLKAAERLRYNKNDVIEAFKQVGIELIVPPPRTVGNRYLFTTLRVISSSARRGCGYADYNCMTRLCKSDLRDNSAWRGWAGCYRSGSKFQCYFECGQVRKFF
jgi:Zn-dependent metalloprotease